MLVGSRQETLPPAADSDNSVQHVCPVLPGSAGQCCTSASRKPGSGFHSLHGFWLLTQTGVELGGHGTSQDGLKQRMAEAKAGGAAGAAAWPPQEQLGRLLPPHPRLALGLPHAHSQLSWNLQFPANPKSGGSLQLAELGTCPALCYGGRRRRGGGGERKGQGPSRTHRLGSLSRVGECRLPGNPQSTCFPIY